MHSYNVIITTGIFKLMQNTLSAQVLYHFESGPRLKEFISNRIEIKVWSLYK